MCSNASTDIILDDIIHIMPTEISLHIKVRKIINKYDPIRLLDMGCPEDEYDGEARRIARRLKNSQNSEQVLNLVHRIFIRMFDEKLAGSKENYQQLATDLYKLR